MNLLAAAILYLVSFYREDTFGWMELAKAEVLNDNLDQAALWLATSWQVLSHKAQAKLAQVFYPLADLECHMCGEICIQHECWNCGAWNI